MNPIYDAMVLNRLDFELTKQCEGNGTDPCTSEGTIFVAHSCCGYDYYVCDAHFQNLVNLIRRTRGNAMAEMRCLECGLAPAPTPRVRCVL